MFLAVDTVSRGLLETSTPSGHVSIYLCRISDVNGMHVRRINRCHIGFEVLTAVAVNDTVFWAVTLSIAERV
jgi:hypothetical protein